ncbi:MAG: hypothetical protein R2748_23125 [Bryobacterales bacterium]
MLKAPELARMAETARTSSHTSNALFRSHQARNFCMYSGGANAASPPW